MGCGWNGQSSILCRDIFHFTATVFGTGLMATPSPVDWIMTTLSPGETTYLHVMLRLRMCGSVIPCLLHAFHNVVLSCMENKI